MGYSCNAGGCYVTSGSCNCYIPSPIDVAATRPTGITAGDAVFAFAGLLTSLPHVVPFGAAAWATPGADLAAAFNAANGLTVSRDFPQGLVFPKIEGELLDRVKQASEVESHERPVAGEYDRELIACMLEGQGEYTLEAMVEQARLLREADNRDAAGVRTVNLSAAPQQPAEAVYLIKDDFGLWREQTKAEHDWWDGKQNAPARRVLYTTPPPAIDIGKLRELVSAAKQALKLLDRPEVAKALHGLGFLNTREVLREAVAAALIGDGGEKWNG